jgi:predicted  nucleic acid-binding Zn-ribbon protein
MKTTIAIVALCTVLVIGCDNKSEELQQQVGQLQTEKAGLEQTIAERDKQFEEMMHAVNEVYNSLEETRAKEATIVERSEGAEGAARLTSTDARQSMLQSIRSIGATLQENKKKIANLESRLKTLRGEFASLNKLVENMKQTLVEREQSIAALQTSVQGLEATLAEKTQTLNEKETVIGAQQKQMNTAYYVAGTRAELKEKGIITDEGGFLWGLLGSTTVMASGVDQSLFTPIDKTLDQTIHVAGQVDEILPRRSNDFFALASMDKDNSDLTILTPDKFWQDQYLVIVLD